MDMTMDKKATTATTSTTKPSRVYLDVTNACQLRCRHCCTDSGAPFEDELELGEILEVIDQVHGMGIANLVLSGGEPLLRADLGAIIERARGLGLEVTLLTNGLLIDERWAGRLIEQGVRVKISLDGATARTHDFLRGEGTFVRTCQVLRRLLRAGATDLTVHYTVHRKSFLELAVLPDLLRRLGVPNLVIGTIKPSGRAQVNAELLIPPGMVPYVHQKVNAIKRRAGISVLQFSDRGWGEFGCPASCNKLGITASGRLTTCAFFGESFLGGSVRESTLEELWRDHLERGDIFVANKTCARCAALQACGGGCRARALYYYGDLNATDPYCCALYSKQLFLQRHREVLLAARKSPLGAFA
jgi:radical SAM protein with 4Fe4S-binding SPASM domain